MAREQIEESAPKASVQAAKASSNPLGKKSVRQPETGTRLSAIEIHENIRAPAEEELERPASSLVFSSIAAGMLIGISFLSSAFLPPYAPETIKHPLATAAYPIGFMFVILGRNELFTENTLERIIPLLHKRDDRLEGVLDRKSIRLKSSH